MRRQLLGVALSLLVAGCAKAPDDTVESVVAYYDRGTRVDSLVVKAAEGGDATLTLGKSGLLLLGGKEYLVEERPVHVKDRTYRLEPVTVARADLDTLAAEAKARTDAAIKAGKMTVARPVTRIVLPDGTVLRFPAPPRFELAQTGTAEVEGQKGDIWELRQVGEASGLRYEAVVSDDPALAPIGAMLVRQYAPRASGSGTESQAPDSFDSRMAELYAKGTVLRLVQRAERDGVRQQVDMFRLNRIERVALPRSEFAVRGRRDDLTTLRKAAEERRKQMPFDL